MDNFDLNYLRYFYYVVQANGFTRAATILNVQQPVISRAVKLLEQQFGFKLLERQKKQTLLTIEGRAVFQMAQKIFSATEQITEFTKNRREHMYGDLCFASSDSLSKDVLGPLLKKLHLEYPDVRPIHHAGPLHLLLDKIRSGVIEFGVYFNANNLPPDLDRTKLTDVPFEFVISKAALKNKEVLESFIASQEQDDQDNSRLPLFEKYKSRHKQAKIAAISSSSMARRDMVLNGLGVTILPRFLIRHELKSGQLIAIQSGDYELPLYIVERKSSYRSKMKNSMLQKIKEIVEG